MLDATYNLEEIVNDLKEVTNYDINFITTEGIILHSTNPKRKGSVHEIGKQVCQSGKTIEVSDDNIASGVKAGVNSPIIINNTVVGCIGVTGDPEDVRQFQAITKKLTERYIQAQLYFQDASNSKKLNYRIIKNILCGNQISIFSSDMIAKDLRQNQEMYVTAIYDLPDTIVDRLLREYQTIKLCAEFEKVLYFVVDKIFLKELSNTIVENGGQILIGQVQNLYNQLNDAVIDLKIMSTSRCLLPPVADLNQLTATRVVSYEYYYNHDYYYTHVISKLQNQFGEQSVTNLLKLFITYIDCDKSVSLAATNEHLTVSTVKYKISKLYKTLEISKNLQDSMLIYIAAKIYFIDINLKV